MNYTTAPDIREACTPSPFDDSILPEGEGMPLGRLIDRVNRLRSEIDELRSVLGQHADRVWGERPETVKASDAIGMVAGGGMFGELENAVSLAKQAFNQLREEAHRNCDLA